MDTFCSFISGKKKKGVQTTKNICTAYFLYYDFLLQKSDVKFRQVLFEIGTIRSRNRINALEISQYEGCRLPLGEHQTPHQIWHEPYSSSSGFSAYFVLKIILLTRRNSILRKPYLKYFINQKTTKYWEEGITKLL